MATTAHYGWTKGVVGGDSGAWGTILNALFDAADASLYGVDGRVATLEGQTLNTRLTSAEGSISTLNGQTLNTRLTSAEGSISTLNGQTLNTRVTALEGYKAGYADVGARIAASEAAIAATVAVANAALPKAGGALTGDVDRTKGAFTAPAASYKVPTIVAISTSAPSTETAPDRALWFQY